MDFWLIKGRGIVLMVKSTTWSREVSIRRGFKQDTDIFKHFKNDYYPLLIVLLISLYKMIKTVLREIESHFNKL